MDEGIREVALNGLHRPLHLTTDSLKRTRGKRERERERKREREKRERERERKRAKEREREREREREMRRKQLNREQNRIEYCWNSLETKCQGHAVSPLPFER